MNLKIHDKIEEQFIQFQNETKKSLRTISKELKISPTSLSLYLGKKRNLSNNLLEKIIHYIFKCDKDINAIIKELNKIPKTINITDQSKQDLDFSSNIVDDELELLDFKIISLLSNKHLYLTLKNIHFYTKTDKDITTNHLNKLIRLELIELKNRRFQNTNKITGSGFTRLNNQTPKYIKKLHNQMIHDIYTKINNEHNFENFLMSGFPIWINKENFKEIQEDYKVFANLLREKYEKAKSDNETLHRVCVTITEEF